jgi:DNA ligase-1
MHIIKFFEEINSTNSLKEKEAILSKYKNDEYLAELINRNLDPYKLFQFNKIPNYTANPEGKKGIENYKAFINLTDKLLTRNITGNAAKEEVIKFFTESNNEEAKIYEKILLKESLGIGATTVNKVWKNFIPEFKVMLAPNKLPELTQLKYPSYVQPKLDGYRCIYWEGKLWSRSGRPFPNKNLSEYFKSLNNVKNYIFDGELYIHGIKFQDLTKILNAENISIPNELKYIVYDCLPEKDWCSQKSNIAYQDRLTNLREILNDRVADYKKVIDISSDIVNQASEVLPLYKKYLKNGYEGIMIKDITGLYRWKRVSLKSGEMVKLKPFKTIDVKIKEIYDGEGNFKNMAGGVVVDYNGVAVSIGSGFDLFLRKKMAEQPNDFIGKTIEIQYFEETDDGSLRFPTFKRFRPEKD